MKLSDIRSAEDTIENLPDELDKDDLPSETHDMDGAERFMTLQNKVIAMMPEELFPTTSAELLELNNLIFTNIKEQRSDIPRNVITRWEHMSPTRKKREVENPLHYT